jgi:gluconokinase
MPAIPELRSPYAKVGRLVYFGRMLDKIRLHAAGRLPPEYVSNLGDAKPIFFDGRCCRFLQVPYEAVRQRTLEGGTDEEVLAWAEAHGRRPTDEECVIWNRFMTKVGWRDDRSAVLQVRIAEFGLTGRPIETVFDLIDYDEARDPVAARAWDSV